MDDDRWRWTGKPDWYTATRENLRGKEHQKIGDREKIKMGWTHLEMDMEEERPGKEMVEMSVPGRRKRGRQRTRWMDAVEREMQELGL